MHSVITSSSACRRPQCSSFLLSSLCLLLVMASPWRTGATSEASLITKPLVVTTTTVLPKTVTESSVETTTKATTAKTASSGIARLKAELLASEEKMLQQPPKVEVGHVDIRDADAKDEPADHKDEVKFASGLWLARSKRSTASDSRYLHNGSSWKRRGRVHEQPAESESSSLHQQSDHSFHHVPVHSIADNDEMMASELMAAGRDMAMQMMKRRPPPGGQGRMYDVPQIGESTLLLATTKTS